MLRFSRTTPKIKILRSHQICLFCKSNISIIPKNLKKALNPHNTSKYQGVYQSNGLFPNSTGIYLSHDNDNRLNRHMSETIITLINNIYYQDHIQALFFKGVGPHFCKGRQWLNVESKQLEDALKTEYNMYREIYNSPKATVTVLHGEVGTPGLAMALFAKARIAAMDATFSCLDNMRGWFPDCGIIWFLTRLKYNGAGLWLALTGTRINAVSMRTLGLVDYVIPYPETTEDIRQEFGQLYKLPWEHSYRHLDRAISLFADHHSEVDPLARYLPFIDLCFGGVGKMLTPETIGQRLRLVAEGNIFEAIEARQNVSNFDAIESVEKFDLGGGAIKVPEMLRQWARDCLISLCSAPLFSTEITIEIYKKSIKMESPMIMLFQNLTTALNIVEENEICCPFPELPLTIAVKRAKINAAEPPEKMAEYLGKNVFTKTVFVPVGGFARTLFTDEAKQPPARLAAPRGLGYTFIGSPEMAGRSLERFKAKTADYDYLANGPHFMSRMRDDEATENTFDVHQTYLFLHELISLQTPKQIKTRLHQDVPEDSEILFGETTDSGFSAEDRPFGHSEDSLLPTLRRPENRTKARALALAARVAEFRKHSATGHESLFEGLDRSTEMRQILYDLRSAFFVGTAADFKAAEGRKPECFIEYARFLAMRAPDDFVFLKRLSEHKVKAARRNDNPKGTGVRKLEKAEAVLRDLEHMEKTLRVSLEIDAGDGVEARRRRAREEQAVRVKAEAGVEAERWGVEEAKKWVRDEGRRICEAVVDVETKIHSTSKVRGGFVVRRNDGETRFFPFAADKLSESEYDFTDSRAQKIVQPDKNKMLSEPYDILDNVSSFYDKENQRDSSNADPEMSASCDFRSRSRHHEKRAQGAAELAVLERMAEEDEQALMAKAEEADEPAGSRGGKMKSKEERIVEEMKRYVGDHLSDSTDGYGLFNRINCERANPPAGMGRGGGNAGHNKSGYGGKGRGEVTGPEDAKFAEIRHGNDVYLEMDQEE